MYVRKDEGEGCEQCGHDEFEVVTTGHGIAEARCLKCDSISRYDGGGSIIATPSSIPPDDVDEVADESEDVDEDVDVDPGD